jgi:hypothetical protein
VPILALDYPRIPAARPVRSWPATCCLNLLRGANRADNPVAARSPPPFHPTPTRKNEGAPCPSQEGPAVPPFISRDTQEESDPARPQRVSNEVLQTREASSPSARHFRENDKGPVRCAQLPNSRQRIHFRQGEARRFMHSANYRRIVAWR